MCFALVWALLFTTMSVALSTRLDWTGPRENFLADLPSRLKMETMRKRSRRTNGEAPRSALIILVLSRANELSISRGGPVWSGWRRREGEGAVQREDEDDDDSEAAAQNVSPIFSVDIVELHCTPLTMGEGRVECLSFFLSSLCETHAAFVPLSQSLSLSSRQLAD